MKIMVLRFFGRDVFSVSFVWKVNRSELVEEQSALIPGTAVKTGLGVQTTALPFSASTAIKIILIAAVICCLFQLC